MSEKPVLRELLRGVLAGLAACIVFIVGGSLLVGLGCGVVLYAASFLITNQFKRAIPQLAYENQSEEYWSSHLIKMGTDYSNNILQLGRSIEDKEVQREVAECYEICAKIIDTVQSKPEAAQSVAKFFRYYLPSLSKILTNYVESERAGVLTPQFKKSVSEQLDTVEVAMKNLHQDMFQKTIRELSADIEVITQMAKRDGLLESDFVQIDTEQPDEKEN